MSAKAGSTAIRGNRADWLLMIVAVVGFGVAWLARTYELGSIGTRATLVGAGKAVGYLFVALFIAERLRHR